MLGRAAKEPAGIVKFYRFDEVVLSPRSRAVDYVLRSFSSSSSASFLLIDSPRVPRSRSIRRTASWIFEIVGRTGCSIPAEFYSLMLGFVFLLLQLIRLCVF